MERAKPLMLTDRAAERARQLIAQSEKPVAGLRVGVKTGGCSGLAYFVEYAEAAEAAEDVIEDKGVKLFIDPKSIIYLLGTEMDYHRDKLQSGFTFSNPNEKDRCGCGESFRI